MGWTICSAPSAATGAQPWARLYEEGHADHGGPAADYVRAHLAEWRAALLGLRA